MKKKLTENIPIKILSLIIGILIWLIVANIDNPIISKSFTISNVELINEAYIDDTGKVCLRDGSQTPVRVTITGESKLLRKISSEDVHATADLQQAVSLETDPVMIPITATVAGITANNISLWPQNLSVKLEDKVTSEFMVSVVNEGKPGKGYEIGSQIVSPEKVRITGPESLMNKIDKVTAVVDVSGITTDTTVEVPLNVIDKNAETIDDVALSNLRFDTGGKVTVYTKLWKVRTDVGIDVVYSGSPAEGYAVYSVTTVPGTVSVAGSTEALELLKEQGNVILLEDESLDISGSKTDVEAKLNLAEALPEGLKLTSGSSDEVMVTVHILPEGGQIVSIPTSAIVVNNKPEAFQAAFEVDKVELRVISEQEEAADLDPEQIEAYIDLGDVAAGTHEIPIDVKLPEGYQLLEEPTTEITVSVVSTIEEGVV